MSTRAPAAFLHEVTIGQASMWSALFLLTFLFLVPIYRVAKSRGYPAAAILTGVIAYSVTLTGVVVIASIAGARHWLMGAAWVPVSLVLVLLQLLPARRGAPGQAWFTITARCRECGAVARFDRDREGLMETCPECGEIFRVPRQATHSGAETAPDDAGPAAAPRTAREGDPGATDDDAWTVLRGYDALPLAELDGAALEDAGIPVIVRSLAPNNIYPTALGCELLVPATQRERAKEALQFFPDEASQEERP